MSIFKVGVLKRKKINESSHLSHNFVSSCNPFCSEMFLMAISTLQGYDIFLLIYSLKYLQIYCSALIRGFLHRIVSLFYKYFLRMLHLDSVCVHNTHSHACTHACSRAHVFEACDLIRLTCSKSKLQQRVAVYFKGHAPKAATARTSLSLRYTRGFGLCSKS